MAWPSINIPGLGSATGIGLVTTITIYALTYKFVGIALEFVTVVGMLIACTALAWIIGFFMGRWTQQSADKNK